VTYRVIDTEQSERSERSEVQLLVPPIFTYDLLTPSI
jgi:hypothetical protein